MALVCTSVATYSAETRSIRQLAAEARAWPAKIWQGASVSVTRDEHDLVVEFRVNGGDAYVRESLRAFIDLAAEFGEREKEKNEMFFSKESDCMGGIPCRFEPLTPYPRARPRSSLVEVK